MIGEKKSRGYKMLRSRLSWTKLSGKSFASKTFQNNININIKSKIIQQQHQAYMTSKSDSTSSASNISILNSKNLNLKMFFSRSSKS